MHINPKFLREIKKQKGTVHIVLIGTKPDIIKQAPLILSLKKRGHFTLVVHSGQHTQFNLSGGLEEEFGIIPDINLEIGGNLYTQQSQIIARFGSLLAELKKLNKRVIPYICADTTTALAAGIASFANMISTAHVEAGLRTMSPPRDVTLSLLTKGVDIYKYFQKLKEHKLWEKGSYEPYPEQFDTRAAGPSAGVHFAPTPLNAHHLYNEGYEPERVYIVGNAVSDAIEYIHDKAKKTKIFDSFPQLLNGDIIRFCIHRRENVTSYQRFISIFEAMVHLIKEGRTVILISLGATERALEEYRLKKRTIELSKKYKNFVYTPVLPYYSDTIAIMKKCNLVVTDSGSIQEETNILGIPGVVVRFNTDRPEAVFNGSNVIAPPITSDVVLKVIDGVLENEKVQQNMKNSSKLYGKNVSNKIVSIIEKSLDKYLPFNIFEFLEQDRLGLSDKVFWNKKKTNW